MEQELFDEEPGEAFGIVTDDAVFFEQVVGHKLDLQFSNAFGVDANRLGTLRAVTLGNFLGDRSNISNNRIDHALLYVILDGANVLAEGVAGGFAGLSHEIGDVNAMGFGASDAFGNFRNQEIRNDAGVKRAGPHEDEVGLLDSLDRGGKRANPARGEFEPANGSGAARDIGFTLDTLAVRESSDEVNIGNGGRKDAAANGEDFARNAHGFGKIAGDMSESSEKKVAEVVPAEPAPGLKPILEETAEKSFVFGQRYHAVSNVAGRQNAIFAAQAAGTAPVVGDRDDCGKVSNGALGRWTLVGAANNV